MYPFAASASSDFGFEFQFGHWVGKPELSSAGEIESCMISEHNDRDELLILRLDNARTLTLGVFEKQWPFDPPAASLPIVAIDHRIMVLGPNHFLAKSALVLELINSDSSLNAMVNGRFLSVSVSDIVTVFDLTGADEAIAYLLSCVSIRGLRLQLVPDGRNTDAEVSEL